MTADQDLYRTIRDYFTYRDGELYHLHDRKGARADTSAGHISRIDGYCRISVFYKKYKRSRLVFLYHHGYLPEQVDHMNGDPSDDRIENLRAATQTQNQGNTKLIRKSNSSGYRGVSYSASRGRYEAKLQKDGITLHLGRFVSAEDAARAYNAKARQVFGEFAKLNQGVSDE